MICSSFIISIAFSFQPQVFEFVTYDIPPSPSGPQSPFFIKKERDDIRGVFKWINKQLGKRQVKAKFFNDRRNCVHGNGRNEICMMDFQRADLSYYKKISKLRKSELNGIAYGEAPITDCDIFLDDRFVYDQSYPNKYWDNFLKTIAHEVLHCKGFKHINNQKNIMNGHIEDQLWKLLPCQVNAWRWGGL